MRARPGFFKKAALVSGILFLAAGPGKKTLASPEDYTPHFETQIRKAVQSISQNESRRPLKLRSMNDSLQKTARAARMFLGWQVADSILSLLDSAVSDYPENYFTLFFKGLVFDLRGDRRSADRYFEDFLIKGRTYTDFEKAFITQSDFQALRREIESLLAGRGVSLAGLENRIRARVPMQGLENYRRKPSSRDTRLNIVFLVVIIGGGVSLLLAALGGAEFWRPPLRSLLGMYFAVWIAYGIWILDLAFELPYGVSRFKVIPIFLGAAAAAFAIREAFSYWTEKTRPLEEGFKRCPHCRRIVVKLATECFFCKKKL